MLVLFDHSTPRGLARSLTGHTVRTARMQGWDELSNGDLLAAAEKTGFEALVTPDKSIRYQQNLKGRKIAIVVLGNPQWPALRRYVERVVAALNAATAGSYVLVEIPMGRRRKLMPPPAVPLSESRPDSSPHDKLPTCRNFARSPMKLRRFSVPGGAFTSGSSSISA